MFDLGSMIEHTIASGRYTDWRWELFEILRGDRAAALHYNAHLAVKRAKEEGLFW